MVVCGLVGIKKLAGVFVKSVEPVNLSCAQKKIYFTERRAIQARLRIRQMFHSDQRVYLCDQCGWFHLTSRLLRHQLNQMSLGSNE